MDQTKEKLSNMYRLMLLSRYYEEKANSLYKEKCFEEKPLSGIGQEAVSVGAVLPLNENDYIAPTLRTKGAYFAKGMSAYECYLELFRKKDSISKGFWTSHHVGNMDKGIILTSALVSSSLSVATGVALSAKLRKSNQVVVAFFGDGGSSRADFHTSINFASVMDLPIVFVCENNLHALATPICEQMKNPDVASRAAGYGIPGIIVDGQNILEVYDAAEQAIYRAREGKGPTLLECKTYRFRGHTESHDPDDGRPADELEKWRARCPIEILHKYILSNTNTSEDELLQIRTQTYQEIELAAKDAKAMPDAEPDNFESYVYA